VRKYETEYRVDSAAAVAESEAAFRLAIDLRLDAVERDVGALGSDASALVARVLNAIETEISPRAAEIEALLADYRQGVPAASVEEEETGRQFLTPARRAAIIAEILAGVAEDGNSLAKLYALIVALDLAKASLASPALTGTPTAPTAAGGTNTTQIATAAFVAAAVAVKAPLASPALTGTPTAPTAPVGTNTTQIASTAFVKAAIDALKGAAPAAYDTLVEIANWIAADETAEAALTTSIGNRLRLDAAGGYNSTQQAQGRSNLGLGTAATAAVGTAVGNAIAVQAGGKLPALSGADLTNLPLPAALSTAAGSAPSYAARAFVMFDGTLSAAAMIWTTKNVTSITDNGVGSYTVNFTTAMQDQYFAVAIGHGGLTDTASALSPPVMSRTVNSVAFQIRDAGGVNKDSSDLSVTIFR